MRILFLLAVNTVRVLFKRLSNLILYALPVLGVGFALLFSTAGETRLLRVGVADLDGSAVSHALVAALGGSDRFTIRAVETASLSIEVAAGRLDCGLVIPEGYGAGFLDGVVEPLTILSLRGKAVTGWIGAFGRIFADNELDLAAAAGGAADEVEVLRARVAATSVRLTVDEVADVSLGRAAASTSLGYLVMFLMLGAGMSTQLVLADKRSRTYHRIGASPVRPHQYVVANSLGALSIIAVQILLVILLTRALGLDTGVSALGLFAILLLFGLVAVTLGLLITSVSRTTTMANALSTLILSPTCLLAGCFFPSEMMPVFLQRLALFTPQRWVLDALAYARDGAGIETVGPRLLVVAAFAVTFAVLATHRFARAEESTRFV